MSRLRGSPSPADPDRIPFPRRDGGRPKVLHEPAAKSTQYRETACHSLIALGALPPSFSLLPVSSILCWINATADLEEPCRPLRQLSRMLLYKCYQLS